MISYLYYAWLYTWQCNSSLIFSILCVLRLGLVSTDELRNQNQDTFECQILSCIVGKMRQSNHLQKTTSNFERVLKATLNKVRLFNYTSFSVKYQSILK